MAEIHRISTPRTDLVENIRMIYVKALRGEIEQYVFAGMTSDGKIATSWSDGSSVALLGDRQNLVSHLWLDVTMAAVERNFIDGEGEE